MNHYELHDKATTLAESESRYALARRVLKLEAEQAVMADTMRDTTDSSTLDDDRPSAPDTIHQKSLRLII